MNETLSYPEIDAPAAPASPLATIDLQALALSRFGDWRPKAKALVDKYKGVIFDVTTPKGMADATAARIEVRAPRYAAQNVSKASKSELARVSKAIGAEEQAIIDALAETEAHIHAQIEAENSRRAAIEAARVAKHRAGIETIRSYAAQAQGKTAAQITAAITALMALSFGDEWQEFRDEAAEAAIATRDALVALRDATAEREAEAARIEAQRIENARVAAEQAERQRKLDEQAAAIQRQADELAAERAAAALAQSAAAAAATVAQMAAAPIVLAATPNPLIERHVVITDKGELAAPNTPAPGSQHVLKAEAATPDATDSDAPAIPSPVGGPTGAGEPAAAGPVGEALSLTIGKVCARLGFIVSAEFLGTLGFTAKAERSSRLFREQDFPAMCAKLAEHVLRVGEEHSK